VLTTVEALSIIQQDHLGHTVSLHSYSINAAVPSELSKLPRFVVSLKFVLSYFLLKSE